MLKDILVPWINVECERSVADAALSLAAWSGAHVAVLVTVDVPAPMPTDWGAMAYDIYAKLHTEAHARASERAETLRRRFAHADAPVEVRVTEAVSVFPQNTATMHARYADLTVLPAMPRDGPNRCWSTIISTTFCAIPAARCWSCPPTASRNCPHGAWSWPGNPRRRPHARSPMPCPSCMPPNPSTWS